MGGSVSMIDGHIDEVLKPCPWADIDRSKCHSTEYGLCPRCRHLERFGDICIQCVSVVDIGYAFTICGVPVGSGLAYYHKNFEKQEG